MAMKTKPAVIGTLFRNEIRMALRDRRTVLTSIVLPLLVMPIMLFSSTWMQQRRERKLEATVYDYAVTGSQSEVVRVLIEATRERLAAEPLPAGKTRLQIAEHRPEDPAVALQKRELDFYLEGVTAEEAREAAAKRKAKAQRQSKDDGEAADATSEAIELPATGIPFVSIVFRADRDSSEMGARRMRDALRATRGAERGTRLKNAGFPLSVERVAAVSESNLASEAQAAGLMLGRVLTLLLLFFTFSGGAVVAMDMLAGEKERGTLETLLTTAAGRLEIVVAKHLVILAVAVLITLIQVVNFLVYIGFKLIPTTTNFAAAVSPQVAILLLFLYLPVAALAGSVLLLVSGYARSYKEAQLYFFPVFLLGVLPAISPFLPGLPLRSAIVLIPVANVALAVKEILIGSFDWPMIAVSWLVTTAAAAWMTRLSVGFLSAEKLIAAAEADGTEIVGGPALFEHHVLRWFAVLWTTVILVGNYLPSLDLRVQIVVTQVVLLFGGLLVMIRSYRLNPRQAFAFRFPKPMVFLGVVFGVPAASASAMVVFQLANLVFPVPPKVLQTFSDTLVGKLSTMQLLFFLCVMPAVFEELAYRGVLLHGLRRRMHPAAIALTVGIAFGLLHFSLFRLAPTTFLGIVLASLTLLTGSIFPAMLWHFLNNALGVFAARLGMGLLEPPATVYWAAPAVLAASFWIIWRNRTPYPGLRPWSRKTRSANAPPRTSS